jgi:hypothetical protein
MDPVSLTVAITGTVIAIGGTLVALLRKQESKINANSGTEALDSIIYECTYPTQTTETKTDGTVVTTHVGGSKKLIIREQDAIHNNTLAQNSANGYDKNTIPVHMPTINSDKDEGDKSGDKSDQQTARNTQAQTPSEDRDRPIQNVDIREFASLQDGNILSIRGYQKGDIKFESLYYRTTNSKDSAAYTHLVKDFQAKILPEIMRDVAGHQSEAESTV